MGTIQSSDIIDLQKNAHCDNKDSSMCVILILDQININSRVLDEAALHFKSERNIKFAYATSNSITQIPLHRNNQNQTKSQLLFVKPKRKIYRIENFDKNDDLVSLIQRIIDNEMLRINVEGTKKLESNFNVLEDSISKSVHMDEL